MELKFRKDLQQLKFYQTLNSFKLSEPTANAQESGPSTVINPTPDRQMGVSSSKSKLYAQPFNRKKSSIKIPSELEARAYEITKDLNMVNSHFSDVAEVDLKKKLDSTDQKQSPKKEILPPITSFMETPAHNNNFATEEDTNSPQILRPMLNLKDSATEMPAQTY